MPLAFNQFEIQAICEPVDSKLTWSEIQWIWSQFWFETQLAWFENQLVWDLTDLRFNPGRLHAWSAGFRSIELDWFELWKAQAEPSILCMSITSSENHAHGFHGRKTTDLPYNYCQSFEPCTAGNTQGFGDISLFASGFQALSLRNCPEARGPDLGKHVGQMMPVTQRQCNLEAPSKTTPKMIEQLNGSVLAIIFARYNAHDCVGCCGRMQTSAGLQSLEASANKPNQCAR